MVISATARAAVGDLYETDFSSGNVYKISSDGTVTAFLMGFVNPTGLAFDSKGNLFVADSVFTAGAGKGKIYKISPDGTVITFASGLNRPFGLAFDSEGDLFAADSGSGTIFEFLPAGTKATFASGLSTPAGLAFDGTGNLLENDFSSGTIFKFTFDGNRTPFASGLNSPDGLAVDTHGNVFEGDTGSGRVFKFNPSGARTTAVSGLSQPNGVAVDHFDNFFVSDNATGFIWKFTPAGTGTIFASGFSNPQYLAFEPATDFPLNISTRMRVLTGDNVLIAGFIVTGFEAKRVIIRGIGSSLSGVGVTLSDPSLELHQGSTTLATNDNWKINDQTHQSQEAEVRATTIPPKDDLESAIVATLAPGSYSVILAGKSGGTGVGVVEVYDLAPGTNSKLGNISSRGFVDTDDNVMIGGFIAGGGTGNGARVIVRALGPSIPLPGALADPTLELHDQSGTTLATNDNWKTRPDGSSQQAEVEATTIPPPNELESAIVQTLPPGNYTAVVRGKDNATGIGLVEVYSLK
jgi:sugar lactone lactonase YvrE